MSLDLRSGAAGKARVFAKAKGPSLTLPPLPIGALPLTVQLGNDVGTCWSATYDADVRTNDVGAFKATSD